MGRADERSWVLLVNKVAVPSISWVVELLSRSARWQGKVECMRVRQYTHFSLDFKRRNEHLERFLGGVGAGLLSRCFRRG